MKSRGITLTETLVVIVIIVLLASLLIPMTNYTRKQGIQSKHLTEGRQIQMALLIYMDSEGRLPESSLDFVVQNSAVTPPMLVTATDSTQQGYYGELLRCSPSQIKTVHRQSFEYLFQGGTDSVQRNLRRILTVDENPGILALRTLGERFSDARLSECLEIFLAYRGTMLRFRMDGSSETVQFKFYEKQGKSGTSSLGACYLQRFSDHPRICEVNGDIP